MVKAMYSGVSGLRAHQSKMDVIGNNIANVSTWGYKAMNTSFKESVYQTMINSSGGSLSDGGYGGVNPSMIGYGSMVSAISSNFTSGNQVYTGKGLDCFIDGTAFFAVGPMLGSGTVTQDPESLNVSRVGNFGIVNGYLVDSNGRYVYGFNIKDGITQEVKEKADGSGDYDGPEFVDDELIIGGKGGYTMKPDADGKLGPIKIPTHMLDDKGDKVPVNLTSFTIGADGMLYGVDIDTKKSVPLGCVALVSVQNPNGLSKADGPYYKIGGSSGSAKVVQPGGTAGTLIANHLESANVDIANEFSEMITTQRGFQANTKIITVTDEMLQELVNMKR